VLQCIASISGSLGSRSAVRAWRGALLGEML